MTLFRHLVQADVRQFRLALAIWCALVITAATIHGVRPSCAGDFTQYELLGLLAALVWTGGLLVMLGFTAQAVHAHSLVGTTAFWMTRPIPPWTLLAAKLALVGIVLVLVPVFAEVVLMTVHGASLESMVALALQAAVAQAFWVVLAMAFAALTPALPQFFLVCAATPLALALGLFLLTLTASVFGWGPMPSPAVFEHSRAGAAFLVLVIIAAASLLLVLYRTRSRPRAILIGAAMFLLALSLPELMQRPAASNLLPQWAGTLQPTIDPASIRTGRTLPNDGDIAVHGRISLAGMPSNWSASVSVNRAEIEADGKALPHSAFSVFPDYATPPPVFVDGQETSTERAMKSILGVDAVLGLPSSDRQLVKLVGMDQSARDDFSQKAIRYRGRLTLAFSERTLAAVMPLRRGASFNDGTTNMKMMTFDVSQEQHVSMTVRESAAKTVRSEQAASSLEIFLRNPATREAVYGEYGFGSQEFSPSILWPVAIVTEGRPFGFRVEAKHFQIPSYSSNANIRLDPAWLARAELVIVRSRQVGSLERTLDIPSVTLAVAPQQ